VPQYPDADSEIQSMITKKNRLAYPITAVDIDGTILDSRKEIQTGFKPALEEYESTGGRLVLVTGRPFPAAMLVYDALELDTPLVCENGSYVLLPSTGEVLHRSLLDSGTFNQIMRLISLVGAAVFVADNERILLQGEYKGFRDILRDAGLEVLEYSSDHRDLAIGKITVLGIEDVLLKLSEKISASRLSAEVNFSGRNSLDITPVGVNKGSGLQVLSSCLNVPLDQFIVVGDSENDLSMFEHAGQSVAMGNAEECVLAAADLVAPGNDENGAAWVLREIAMSNA